MSTPRARATVTTAAVLSAFAVAAVPAVASTSTAATPAPAASGVDSASTSITASVPYATRTNSTAYVKGTVSGPAGRPVVLQRLMGTKWIFVSKRATNAKRAYATPFVTRSVGHYQFRAYAPAFKGYKAATSRMVLTHIGGGSPASWAHLGSKARWNPCTTIGYRFNPNNAPAGALNDVKVAVKRISLATGINFAYRGTTSYIPGTSSSFKERYPSDTKIVIAWAYPGTTPLLPTSVKGTGLIAVGGWKSYNAKLYKTYYPIKQGLIALRADLSYPSGYGPSSNGTWGSVVMHEMGHVMGLGHVNDSEQQMYPYLTSRIPHWGLGDLTGLRIKGRASGCIPASYVGAAAGGVNVGSVIPDVME